MFFFLGTSLDLSSKYMVVQSSLTPTQMNSADDLLRAHSLGDPGPASVHQPHYVTALSTCLAHDRHLGS